MPKSTKPAPPQQSSLHEMWGKGKGKAKKNEPSGGASESVANTAELEEKNGRPRGLSVGEGEHGSVVWMLRVFTIFRQTCARKTYLSETIFE